MSMAEYVNDAFGNPLRRGDKAIYHGSSDRTNYFHKGIVMELDEDRARCKLLIVDTTMWYPTRATPGEMTQWLEKEHLCKVAKL